MVGKVITFPSTLSLAKVRNKTLSYSYFIVVNELLDGHIEEETTEEEIEETTEEELEETTEEELEESEVNGEIPEINTERGHKSMVSGWQYFIYNHYVS